MVFEICYLCFLGLKRNTIWQIDRVFVFWSAPIGELMRQQRSFERSCLVVPSCSNTEAFTGFPAAVFRVSLIWFLGSAILNGSLLLSCSPRRSFCPTLLCSPLEELGRLKIYKSNNFYLVIGITFNSWSYIYIEVLLGTYNLDKLVQRSSLIQDKANTIWKVKMLRNSHF